MAKMFSEDTYCLGLQMKDGHICKNNNYHVEAIGAPTFMNQFIEKLKIETCPQVEVGPELTEEYIIKKLESYQRLLESGIIEETTSKLIIHDTSYLKEKSKVVEITKKRRS